MSKAMLGRALAVVAVIVVVVGGAAFAWDRLSGRGAQPQDVLPASALGFLRVDLDPSASQKIAVTRLLRRFPSLAEEIGIKTENTDLRKAIIEGSFDKECGIDFDKDVEPWLGKRIGVAILAHDVEVLAMQVDDEKKARAGIKQFNACDEADAVHGVAFLDGYAIVTDDAADAAKAVDEAREHPLADKESFTRSMEKVGDPGFLSAWVDIAGAMASGDLQDSIDSALAAGIEIPEEFRKIGPAAAALTASDDALRVRGFIEGAEKLTGKGALSAADVPSRAVGALGQSYSASAEKLVRDSFDVGWETGGLTADDEADMREFVGFDVKKTAQDLLLADPLVVVGEQGLHTITRMDGPEDVRKLDVSIHFTGSSGELVDELDPVRIFAHDFAGVDLFVDETKRGAVLATSRDAAEIGSPLSQSPQFTGADLGLTTFSSLLYVDFDKLVRAVAKMHEPDAADFLKNAEPVASLVAGSSGDEFRVVLTFDK